MPRMLRVEYPGAIYHLMSRGDRREDIFYDEVDRHDFLKTLAEAGGKADFQVHAYCLMPNHFHLVTETPNGNLVAGMQWLLSSYTLRLNHRRKLTGHVFSGRYKAILVDGSVVDYLKTVCDPLGLDPSGLGAAQERGRGENGTGRLGNSRGAHRVLHHPLDARFVGVMPPACSAGWINRNHGAWFWVEAAAFRRAAKWVKKAVTSASPISRGCRLPWNRIKRLTQSQ